MAGDTHWAYDLSWLSPFPSKTVTAILQGCSTPVVFVGAVHVGVRLPGSLKVPCEPSTVGHRADHV